MMTIKILLNIFLSSFVFEYVTEQQIVLLNYKKEKCTMSSSTDTTDIKLCMEWHLDSLDILEIIKSSRPTVFREIHILCSVWPCEYIGEVVINGKHYKYSINAGSFMTLAMDNNTYWLIYDKESNFFLEGLWNPEMD